MVRLLVLLASSSQNHSAPIIYKNTLATKILFNGTTAAGILAMTAGTYGTPAVSFTLTAKHEVIFSAEAIQSPQLLMVSGVGNCTELAAFDIPCIVNLPDVGKIMWDHPVFGTAHAVDVDTASAGYNNATLERELIQVFLDTADGLVSVFGPCYYSFEKLPQPYRSALSNSTVAELDTTFPADWPEIEWIPNAAYNGCELNKQTADPKDGKNYGTLMVALVAQLSRGKVTLNSAHFWHLPNVNPAWFTAEADKETALQAFKRQRCHLANICEPWNRRCSRGVPRPIRPD